MKIIHDRIAKIVKAITPRSVLLSTKTKNAHIPLVNHSNNVIHQAPNDIVFHFSVIFFFSQKYSTISFINHKPKNKHKGPDKKFIDTAIVSGDNHHPEKIDPILNQNAINIYHKYGIVPAVHTFHRNRP